MFEYFITTYGGVIANVILCAVFGALGYAVKKLSSILLDTKIKRAVATDVVKFVEQTWKTIHGKEKLKKALEKAEEILKKKGIPFDADEMEVIIEAAVLEFNKNAELLSEVGVAMAEKMAES